MNPPAPAGRSSADALAPADAGRFHVLGTPLLDLECDALIAHCLAWTRRPGPVAIEFANTHVVTMRRTDAAFRALTEAYDGFAPDATPLLWCLRCAGAQLRERVYGPTFMRRFVQTVPHEFTHYLLGGSEEVGHRLRASFASRGLGDRVLGSFHGRCGADGVLAAGADAEVMAALERLAPDFIWVGLGTPKQQAWVQRHKSHLRRGVVLTVGFAFDVNAGTKPDAPMWMQRAGLTWLFRMRSEPARLGPRFLRYNALFLACLAWDGARGTAWGRLRKPAG